MNTITNNEFIGILPETAVVRKDIYSGALISVKLLPIFPNKILSRVAPIIPHLLSKRYYFWLPFKHAVNENNYGLVGPNSRKNFANSWFRIETTNPLYSLTSENFKYLLLNKTSDYIKASIKISFFPSDLIKVTSKSLKKELDKILTIK